MHLTPFCASHRLSRLCQSLGHEATGTSGMAPLFFSNLDSTLFSDRQNLSTFLIYLLNYLSSCPCYTKYLSVYLPFIPLTCLLLYLSMHLSKHQTKPRASTLSMYVVFLSSTVAFETDVSRTLGWKCSPRLLGSCVRYVLDHRCDLCRKSVPAYLLCGRQLFQ